MNYIGKDNWSDFERQSFFNQYKRLVASEMIKLNYGVSYSEIEDLVVLTFEIFYLNRNNLIQQEKIISYLIGIARNSFMNYVHSKSKNQELGEFDYYEEANYSLLGDIISKVKVLDDFSKFVLVRYFYYGNTFKEISEIKNVEESTVKNAYYKSLKIVRTFLT